MTLQHRIAAIVGTLFLCLFLILNFFIDNILMERFLDLEKDRIDQNFMRIRHAYEADLENSQITTKDWAEWDDTYRFIGGDDERNKFIENNLMNSSFTNTKLNLMAFANTSGEMYYGKLFDLDRGAEIPMAPEMESLVKSGVVLAPREKSGKRGIVIIGGRPMIFFSWSIMTSEGKGPMRGTAIMGRFLDRSYVRVLSDVTQLPMNLVSIDDPELPDKIKISLPIASRKFKTCIEKDSEEKISGYILFRDIEGRPAFVLKFQQPRNIYLQGRESVLYFKVFSIVIAIFFLFVMMIMIRKYVVERIARLSRSFGDIAGRKDFSVRVHAAGGDELAALASSINITLDVLDNAHGELRREVSERKQAEERLELAMKGADLGIWDMDVPSGFLTYNERWAEMLGFPRDGGKIHVSEWARRVHPEDIPLLMDTLNEHFYGNAPAFEIEHRLNTASGEVIWVLDTGKVVERDRGGKPLRAAGTLKDITGQKLAAEALRKSEDRYRVLFEYSPNAVIIIGIDGKFAGLNSAAFELTGYSEEELIGKYFYDLKIYREEELPDILSAFSNTVSTGDIAKEYEMSLIRKDGERLFVETRNAAIVEDGKTVAMQVIISDITGRKRVEKEKEMLKQQLLQSQKMEAVGTLAGGIAHDFNNILSVILGNTQMAMQDISPGVSAYRDLEEIENAATRAKQLTMKLLTFARKEKITVRSVRVKSMMEDIVMLLRRSIPKNIRIEIILDENLPLVSMDITQIQQVLINICNNACDAMPHGGTLTLGSTKVVIDETCAKHNIDLMPGEYCLVQISDTGVGMDDNVRDRIFEPFFTTKESGKGTGLSLSISFGIIKSHGGFISVFSKPGHGSTFKVFMPFSKDDHMIVEPEESSESVPGGSETILIVDDEKPVLSLGARILEKAGYKTILADNGKSALELYERHRGEIALVMLDMIMPDMDGGEVFRTLKAMNPDVKAILVSGYSIDGQAGALMNEGIMGFIQKPFGITDMRKMIRNVIDS